MKIVQIDNSRKSPAFGLRDYLPTGIRVENLATTSILNHCGDNDHIRGIFKIADQIIPGDNYFLTMTKDKIELRKIVPGIATGKDFVKSDVIDSSDISLNEEMKPGALYQNIAEGVLHMVNKFIKPQY